MKNKIKNLTLTGIALTSLLLTGAPNTFAQTEGEVEFRGRGGSARLESRSSSSGDIRREDRRLGRRENRRLDRRENRRDENDNLGRGGSVRLSGRRNSNDNSGPGSINSGRGSGGSVRLRNRINSNDLNGQNSRGRALLRRRTVISGTAINGENPKGHADFRILPRGRGNRLNVEVQNVNLSNGTPLTVSACGTNVGTITLLNGIGELSIKERNGNTVPTCSTGNTVTVSSATSTILAGSF